MAAMTRREATAEAAVARVLKFARELETSTDNPDPRLIAQQLRETISGQADPPDKPGKLAGRGIVARWLIEDIGAETILAQMTLKDNPDPATLAQRVARVITDAVVRYGWDRPAEALERTPPPPMPAYEIHGDGKVLLAWEISPQVRGEWEAWWRNRPGRDSGYGGRPRKASSEEADSGGGGKPRQRQEERVKAGAPIAHTVMTAATPSPHRDTRSAASGPS